MSYLTGTANEEGTRGITASSSITYELDQAEGLWKPTAGNSKSAGHGNNTYESTGSGNHDETISNTTPVSYLTTNISTIGGSVLTYELPEQADEVRTSNYGGDIEESRSLETNFDYSTDSSLVGGVWSTSGTASSFEMAKSTYRSERIRTHSISIDSSAATYNQSTAKETNVERQVERSNLGEFEVADGLWRKTREANTFVAEEYQSTGNITSSAEFEEEWSQSPGGPLIGGIVTDTSEYAWSDNGQTTLTSSHGTTVVTESDSFTSPPGLTNNKRPTNHTFRFAAGG